MNPSQKQALFDNTARSIQGASAEAKQRHIHHCTQADPEYGSGVALAIEGLA
ncbi:catalase-related domain-containing protein [Pseudomonas brassicacearum]|uniref:catalase-related domain-containing protein n=1 Tax=Pseudomonas brassicacearum TaxID=930166 RepID=UPI00385776DC